VNRLGNARVLVVVYGVLALAATGRSVYQLITKFEDAPLAYSLSAVAAVVYIVATIALARGSRKLAVASMLFELIGVLVVGAISLVLPDLFPHDTVWSNFGQGYLWIPLALPILGLWWLSKGARA
jgi:cytochrome bd-type quinol oxidase subunit 2